MPKRAIETKQTLISPTKISQWLVEEFGPSYSDIGQAVTGLGVTAVSLALIPFVGPIISAALTILGGLIGAAAVMDVVGKSVTANQLASQLVNMRSNSWLMITTTVYQHEYGGGNHYTYETTHQYAVL